MKPPQRIVVLVSGRGSNMAAVARACADEGWPAEVAAVIADRPEAAGLAVASGLNLRTQVVDFRRHGADRAAFNAALAEAIDAHAPDLVLLAGFMRILTPGFVARYEGRLMNVHPSLLPAFTGLHTHRRALAAGVKWAGATVHFVTAELDHGPIVLQAAVPVRPDDDEATLAARVLAQEHLIVPRAVRWFVHGRLRLDGGVVHQLDGEPQAVVSTEA
jgi:phosphoribosylglycinamide formyltransferase-1